jgi:hypothetical protein
MVNVLVAAVFCLALVVPSAFARDYSPAECPVVGNTSSRIYHVAGGRHYAKMLRQNQSGDNRKCFKTTAEATSSGYRQAKQ